MLLKVHPITQFSGTFTVLSSKPETQRAILIASLAKGVSYIHNDLRCLETDIMKKACKQLGAKIIEHHDYLEIHGMSGQFNYQTNTIDCGGSGLVCRIFMAITSVVDKPITITGDDTLCKRVMGPLVTALNSLGANIEFIKEYGCAPVINHGNKLKGGKCIVPGNISSQFITALMLVAPLTQQGIEIAIQGELYSKPYILQTLEAMRMAGVTIDTSHDLKTIKILPGSYSAREWFITEDYTSASYLLATSALFKGHSFYKNINVSSLQGESAIVAILRELGLQVKYSHQDKVLEVINKSGKLKGDYEFNATDYPNIVPTLAAIGSYVEGKFKVSGAAITRFHKASRAEAMCHELRKTGVDIRESYINSICDGFEVNGKESYRGECIFSSWHDHRIFMSLFVASLKMQKPSLFTHDSDVNCSFPSFFQEFQRSGVVFENNGSHATSARRTNLSGLDQSVVNVT